VPSGRLGHADFLARQVTFHSDLPGGQGVRQVICQLNQEKQTNTPRGSKI